LPKSIILFDKVQETLVNFLHNLPKEYGVRLRAYATKADLTISMLFKIADQFTRDLQTPTQFNSYKTYRLHIHLML